MRPNVNEYETIVPANLCSRCQSIVSGDQSKFDDSDGWHRRYFAHHNDHISFQAAVTSGCYVCVRVHAELSKSMEKSFYEAGPSESSALKPWTTYRIFSRDPRSLELYIHSPTQHSRPHTWWGGLYNRKGNEISNLLTFELTCSSICFSK